MESFIVPRAREWAKSASEQVSEWVREWKQANGQASSLVLQSEFLFFLAYSAGGEGTQLARSLRKKKPWKGICRVERLCKIFLFQAKLSWQLDWKIRATTPIFLIINWKKKNKFSFCSFSWWNIYTNYYCMNTNTNKQSLWLYFPGVKSCNAPTN